MKAIGIIMATFTSKDMNEDALLTEMLDIIDEFLLSGEHWEAQKKEFRKPRFPLRDALEASGASEKRVRNWLTQKKGPLLDANTDRISHRRFSVRDVLLLAIFDRLSPFGIHPEKVKEIADYVDALSRWAPELLSPEKQLVLIISADGEITPAHGERGLLRQENEDAAVFLQLGKIIRKTLGVLDWSFNIDHPAAMRADILRTRLAKLKQ